MSFPLVGNSKVRLSIENALKEHRLPHAILIDGDIGTGRHTLARFLSRAIVCNGNDIPCGSCNHCRLSLTDNHPDITVIAPEDGKKNIAVAQIRQLKGEAYIKPHQADKRVFIIDQADTMNEQSQNALLKVLEEPPISTVFILIAESKASLLDTVISRCAVFSLTSPSLEDGVSYISSTADFEKSEIEEALEAFHNNIGKALMMLGGLADSKTAVAAKEFLEYIIRGDQWNALVTVTQFEKSRVEADRFFKDLKLASAKEIKKKSATPRARAYLRLYEKLCELETGLVTNISLSLLFADLTAQAKDILG